MEKLEEQNLVLKKQLLESQMQIKNLTYNVLVHHMNKLLFLNQN